MPELWFGLILIGFIAGIASGMFGIGGGVIIVPTLTLFLHFQPIEAISTSLAALILPVAAFAALAYYRAGLLKIETSALIAVGLLITTWVGAEIALSLPADTLRQTYGIFLLVMSWRFIEPIKVYDEWKVKNAHKDQPAIPQGGSQSAATATPVLDAPWYYFLLLGVVAGIAAGMFGIGGGVIIVPTLVAFLHYDQKHAVGTSLGALLLPVGLPGVLRYAGEGVLDIPVATMVAIGLALGAIIGARIALKLPSKTVKRLYGVFLIFIALRFIFQ